MKQGNGIPGPAAAASQRLHEQIVTSRAEYSSSAGLDRIPHEKLPGAGQDRTAWSVRAAGTEPCLHFPSITSDSGVVLCSCSSALFQHEGAHCNEQIVSWLLQGDSA